MLSFPNNYIQGGKNTLQHVNKNVNGLGADTGRIDLSKIRSANISLNSTTRQNFLDTDVVAITNNDTRIKFDDASTHLGDVVTENRILNMHPEDASWDHNDKLFWDNENPFQIPAGILKTVNRYNRVYKTPVNNLLNIGYDNGEDTELANDSSSYAIEFQGAKTLVVSSIFNPTHMMQVNGLSDNIPIMNLDPGDYEQKVDVTLGSAYELGYSEDPEYKAAKIKYDRQHITKEALEKRKHLSPNQGNMIDLLVKNSNKIKTDAQGNAVNHGDIWYDKSDRTIKAQITATPFDTTKHTVNTANCTVRELVKLSHGRNTIIGQGRYKYSDFLFCKDFGKVSNNHMITLRRFAHPVGDNIFKFSGKKHRNREDFGNNDFQENSSHGTLISWFGTDDNKLDEILKYSVKSTWKEFKSKIKEIDSQEDNEANGLIGMLANSFSPGYNSLVARGMAGTNSLWGHFGSKLIGGLMGRFNLPVAGGATNSNSMRKWDTMRMSADENRIYTPKNTIQATHKYEGELILSHEFTLNFSYKLRAFDLMNPKTVMLDLIGNILEVTYNRGHFWGGENRIIGAPRNSQGVRNINAFIDRQWDKLEGFMMGFANGTLDWKGILGSLSDMVSSAINAIKNAAEATVSSKGQNIVEIAQKLTGQFVRSGASRAMLGQLKNALGRPAAYCMNSLLDGSPVGLWHLTIGNPKNPIAAFGNLIMTNATIQHSGPLGFDDFPTDIKVTCTLKHGRSRDLTEVARMYTKGTGGFYSAVDKNKMSEFFTVSNTAMGSQVDSKLDDLHISQKFAERFSFLKDETKSLEDKIPELTKAYKEEQEKNKQIQKDNKNSQKSTDQNGQNNSSDKKEEQKKDPKKDKKKNSKKKEPTTKSVSLNAKKSKTSSKKTKTNPNAPNKGKGSENKNNNNTVNWDDLAETAKKNLSTPNDPEKKQTSTDGYWQWEPSTKKNSKNKGEWKVTAKGKEYFTKQAEEKNKQNETTTTETPAGTQTQQQESHAAEEALKNAQEKIEKNKKEMKRIKEQAAEMGVDVNNPLTMDKAFPYSAAEQARLDQSDEDVGTETGEWNTKGHFILTETALRYETMGQDRDIEGRILVDEMA